ncbi:MAG: pantoate kinase [Methanocellales archaeon]|nr:pantoate kinase [Methanocellales archaeon]
MNAIKAKAYAPSHITGFFEICESKSAERTGSRGCGFTLQAGTVTEVMVKDGGDTSIQLNGVLARAPTTEFVVRGLAAKHSVEVRSKIDVPIGCGFGASGAGALSTALALNEALSLNLTYERAAKVAHIAEVENKTGLGDVIAQSTGGMIIRKEPGAPGVGIVERIPVGDVKIDYVVFGEIVTRDVLEDADVRREINKAGKDALKKLLCKPTFNEFIRLSRKFAIETGLLSSKAADVIEAVESAGGMASMAMLGDVVFAIDGYEALKEFGDVKTSKICHQGAQLL